MTLKTYHAVVVKWYQRCLSIQFVSWSTFFILHYRVTSELTVAKLIIAEAAIFSWALMDAIPLIRVEHALKGLGVDVDDSVVEHVLIDRRVSGRIARILGLGTLIFAFSLNIVLALRSQSILIPAFYCMFVSLVFGLTSPFTSRLFLQEIVREALRDEPKVRKQSM